MLGKEDLKEIQPYPHASKDEGYSEPGLSGDGHLSFCLQVVAEGDTEEHDTQCHEHDSN